MRRVLPAVLALLLVVSAVPALAQSQAANGTIEGTVRDNSGGVLPGVTVDGRQHRHGHRSASSSPTRAACTARVLLPLGTYRRDGRAGRASRSTSRRGIDARRRPDGRRSTSRSRSAT